MRPTTTRLSRVWHQDERHNECLRNLLEKAPAPSVSGPGSRMWHWPEELLAAERLDCGPASASAAGYAFPLLFGAHSYGVLLVSRPRSGVFAQEVHHLLEELCQRVARTLYLARRHSRLVETSRALQRGLLPPRLTRIPGIDATIVYEPAGEGINAGGDFYDVFQVEDERWYFALGDVCGTGPEAASLTSLARHAVRLLAREHYPLPPILDRLNRAMIEESTSGRFMTLLCGELVPRTDGGALLTLVCAGHVPPLRLRSDGTVQVVASPQLLLGVVDEVDYYTESVELAPGDSLLCVTDGVTERRHGARLLDDNSGLAGLLASCTGLTANAMAERVRRAVHAFSDDPPVDDMALLVLQAHAR
ncbi:MAG: serine/threonine-protein phosphatase [Nocardioidaceae bacterium]|nr:serine/threonine-protein phosphatase [Nocardioidaceae bacterium]